MTPERRQDLFQRVERLTELPMLALAIVFLAVVALEELGDLPPAWTETLEAVLWLIWGAFLFELLVKVYLAPHRGRYLLAHWADVLTVAVPFLRPVRLLRLIVVGARFWDEARYALRHRTFSLIGIASLLTVGISAALVYAAERGGDGPIQTFADALWWAAATITTVGYGDAYPKSPGGRGVAVFLMLSGISLFGLLTARVAAFFVEGREKDEAEPRLGEILDRLDRLERQNAALLYALADRRNGADAGENDVDLAVAVPASREMAARGSFDDDVAGEQRLA